MTSDSGLPEPGPAGHRARQAKRLAGVLAAGLVLALVTAVTLGDASRAWGYVAAGVLTVALAGLTAARLIHGPPRPGDGPPIDGR